MALGYWIHRRTVEQLAVAAEERRREERTGRIRAELKLRTLWKEKEAMGTQSTCITTTNEESDRRKMVLQCIGTIVSPYTKRMGTPRQGSLVPSSRAFIELHIPTEALDGIDAYSHLWVVFGFHANTNAFHKKTKVRPPRAQGNQRVGQLATRSPHRPNPLGLSLVKVEQLDVKAKRLHLSGIDIVNGTPVYDIKPCVPWDIPGYRQSRDNSKPISHLRVPEWVDQEDVIETVKFTDQAQESLFALVNEGRLEPLYDKEDCQAVKAALDEILAQDPRSSHKGLKTNKRGTQDEDHTYKLLFGKVQVEFQVLSRGVRVVDVVAVDFDEDAYVEGIPLISESLSKIK